MDFGKSRKSNSRNWSRDELAVEFPRGEFRPAAEIRGDWKCKMTRCGSVVRQIVEILEDWVRDHLGVFSFFIYRGVFT